MSSIGSSTRNSHLTKTASTAMPTAKAASVSVLDQPLAGAWMRP